jgi:putative redox protein
MSVEIDIDYQGGLHCAATHGPSRQTLATDAPLDNGGKGGAFSPTDLVATALGSCIMTIMGLVAQRNAIDLTGMKAHVVKEMTSTPVRRIHTLKVTVTLPPGRTLSADDRTKLEHAAHTCPVKQSLHPDVAVQVEFVYPS